MNIQDKIKEIDKILKKNKNRLTIKEIETLISLKADILKKDRNAIIEKLISFSECAILGVKIVELLN